MGKYDLATMDIWWEEQTAALQGVLAALQKQSQSEGGHLEALLIQEKTMAEEDEMETEEGELDAIMQAHKRASPFAADVASAMGKWMEVMKK